jgi:ribosomal protein L11 methyltransferase
VDVDPLALEAARYNARRNGVALRVVDAGEPFDDRATITVANILANPLRMLAPVLARHTRPAGCIALSGILHAQAQEVIETYTPWGALDIVASEGAWVLIAGERRADRPC